MSAKPKLSPTDWATIVTLYQRGEKNIRDLAEQFGVSFQAVQQGLKKRGVEKGSDLDEVVGEVKDAARADRERKVKEANRLVDQFSKYQDAIAKLTMKAVMEGSTTGTIAARTAEIIALKHASSTVAKARQEMWDISKVDELLGDLADLPDLNIGEYTPEELEGIRAANEEHYNEANDLTGAEDEDSVGEE